MLDIPVETGARVTMRRIAQALMLAGVLAALSGAVQPMAAPCLAASLTLRLGAKHNLCTDGTRS